MPIRPPPAVPVIAMSAAVSQDPKSPYFIEVDDFVAKPLDLDELLAKLAPWRARSNAEARTRGARP